MTVSFSYSQNIVEVLASILFVLYLYCLYKHLWLSKLTVCKYRVSSNVIHAECFNKYQHKLKNLLLLWEFGVFCAQIIAPFTKCELFFQITYLPWSDAFSCERIYQKAAKSNIKHQHARFNRCHTTEPLFFRLLIVFLLKRIEIYRLGFRMVKSCIKC